jgi:hypothetical protein
MRRIGMLAIALGAHQLAGPEACPGQAMRTFSVTRPIGTERSLRATVDVSGGTVVLVPAPDGELYRLNLRYDGDHTAPVQQYDTRTGFLQLGTAAVGGMGMHVPSHAQPEQAARIELSADVALALHATIGASDATIDLGGMTLTELDVRATATHATIDFSRPTRGPCATATFTVGAAELAVRHLGQAGCETIRVGGGVGSASLRFDGTWRHDQDLIVDLAMGKLTLQVARGTGVRLSGERFLAPFDGKGFVRTGDTWTTPGYDRAAHKLTVELKAAMVAIDVEWIDPR